MDLGKRLTRAVRIMLRDGARCGRGVGAGPEARRAGEAAGGLGRRVAGTARRSPEAEGAGGRGVYVTVEESRESILRTMRHHGLGNEEDFLVDIARLRVEHEGAEEIRDWLRVLKDFLVRRNQREKIDLVVIDTMDVLVSMAHLQDVRNELFHFFHFLRSMGVTTYVIANVDPTRGGVANDVSFLADGVFELRFSGAGEGRVQLLFRCAKMRHTNHSRDYFVLTYDKGFAAKPYEAPKPSRWRRRT